MLQDPNVERVIKNYTEPLQKQISMMQIELEAIKKQCNIGAVSISLERAKKYARHQHFLLIKHFCIEKKC